MICAKMTERLEQIHANHLGALQLGHNGALGHNAQLLVEQANEFRIEIVVMKESALRKITRIVAVK